MQVIEPQSKAGKQFELSPDVLEMIRRQPLNNLNAAAALPEGDVEDEDDDE